MGLKELTTTKYVILGQGQIRIKKRQDTDNFSILSLYFNLLASRIYSPQQLQVAWL